jgi:hypothetical protein
MRGFDPPAGPKPLRRGEGPRIHPETVIPGRELCAKLTKSILSLSERTRNPETVHGAGFRVCAQEGASRNDEVKWEWIAGSSPAMTKN